MGEKDSTLVFALREEMSKDIKYVQEGVRHPVGSSPLRPRTVRPSL